MKARSTDSIRPLLIIGLVAVAHAAVATAQGAEAVTRAKNIMLLYADGSGTNSIAPSGVYTGKLGKQVLDGPGWTKSYVSTYPLRTGETSIEGPDGLAQDPETVYAAEKNWDTTPVATTTGPN